MRPELPTPTPSTGRDLQDGKPIEVVAEVRGVHVQEAGDPDSHAELRIYPAQQDSAGMRPSYSHSTAYLGVAPRTLELTERWSALLLSPKSAEAREIGLPADSCRCFFRADLLEHGPSLS